MDVEILLQRTLAGLALARAQPIPLTEVQALNKRLPSSVAVYIHIPFCPEVCSFCAFHRILGGPERIERYVNSLRQHIHTCLSQVGVNRPVRSLLLGGGTPSVLTPAQVERVLSAVSMDLRLDNVPITFEMHPSNVSVEYIEGLLELGINRFSVGIQSLSPLDRVSMGRSLTSPAQDMHALQVMAGLAIRYNVDLIFGSPGQSLDSWSATLMSLVTNIRPPELTIYQYVNAFGARTRISVARGAVARPGLASRHSMYRFARQYLLSCGYDQAGAMKFILPDYRADPPQEFFRDRPDLIGLGPHTYSRLGSWYLINTSRVHDFVDGGESRSSTYIGMRLPRAFEHLAETTFSGSEHRVSFSAWRAEWYTQVYGVLYYLLNQNLTR
ncbi:MAG TPA: radical SAM protein [Streptosporangiaceae bacterium]|nr:radical SAM protein [Streptosporangiaceae bacterium]